MCWHCWSCEVPLTGFGELMRRKGTLAFLSSRLPPPLLPLSLRPSLLLKAGRLLCLRGGVPDAAGGAQGDTNSHCLARPHLASLCCVERAYLSSPPVSRVLYPVSSLPNPVSSLLFPVSCLVSLSLLLSSTPMPSPREGNTSWCYVLQTMSFTLPVSDHARM